MEISSESNSANSKKLEIKPNDFFQFKGFKVLNKYAPFRINTDGVLLACWVTLSKYDNKLIDIGTGTGVIPCVLNARYNNRLIVGVDSNHDSCVEARFNFILNKLQGPGVIHATIQTYAGEINNTFDHCISNPPYFSESSLPGNSLLAKSKHNAGLSLKELAKASDLLLTDKGSISLILPIKESEILEDTIRVFGFNLKSQMFVKSREFKPVIRRLLHFKRNYIGPINTELLTLYTDDKRSRTEEYEKLVGSVYL